MRLGLRARAILGPLVFAVVPILVSAYFIGDLADVAQSVAQGEVEILRGPLDRADAVYREAINLRKEVFRRAAEAVAADPALRDLCLAEAEPEAVAAQLGTLAGADPDLQRAAFYRRGVEVARVESPVRTEPVRTRDHRVALVEAPDCEVALLYVTPAQIFADHQELGEVFKDRKQRSRITRTLPRYYKIAFIVIVGIVMLLTAAVAMYVAGRTAKRIERLVAATRRVGEGDLEARVTVGGRDELNLLADALNQMMSDLKRSRAEIEYLEKIGAWQEVARRLAHEIKNPLTPIQLAVQELHSKYDGPDPRYRKLLDDAHSIVTEEIDGLRRLVDAFRGFAKLPAVEPKPLDLAVVVDDVARGDVGIPMELDPPPAPVTVAGDRLLLRRALTNLVENSQQAGAKRVRVSWRRAGTMARLVVDDDGPGVPDKMRERIFDPYFTSKEHGTGLGLAIVKKTLLEHRGDVLLAPGRGELGGARFEVSVPLQEATSPAPAAPPDGAGSDPS